MNKDRELDFDMAMWRSDMGWTQEQAGVELGISRRAYHEIENEKTPLSKRTVLACLYIVENPDLYKKNLTYS